MNKINTSHTLRIIGMVVICFVFLLGAVNTVDDRLDLLEYRWDTFQSILEDMRDDLDYIRQRLDETK